jgi:hypothetical protein
MEDTPAEVVSFNQDVAALGPINTAGKWMITEEWKARFLTHAGALAPLAEKGNVAAQYALATIHMLSLAHTSEREAMEAQAQDSAQASRWLKGPAASGHLGALDNLLSVGVGPEAERLRSICQAYPALFHAGHSTQSEWESEMRKLHELAYRS